MFAVPSFRLTWHLKSQLVGIRQSSAWRSTQAFWGDCWRPYITALSVYRETREGVDCGLQDSWSISPAPEWGKQVSGMTVVAKIVPEVWGLLWVLGLSRETELVDCMLHTCTKRETWAANRLKDLALSCYEDLAISGYDDLAHMIMQHEPASWSLESRWLVSVWSSTDSATEEPTLPLKSESAQSCSKLLGSKDGLLLVGKSVSLFYLGLQLIRQGPVTPGRAIHTCFT